MSLFANRDFAPHIRVIFVPQKESIPANHNFPKPFQNIRVIHNLMLDQFLRNGKQNLRADVPKSVDGSFRIPRFDFVGVVKDQKGFHRFLCHVRHGRLVNEAD